MSKCVLVIDPVSTNRIRLSAVMEAAGYRVISAPSAADIARPLPDPDLVVLGLSDRPAKEIASLTTLQIAEQTPLLCIDGTPSALRRLLALRAGARDVLPRKTPDTFLRARMRGLIREREAQRECERRRATAASFGFAEAAPEFSSASGIRLIGRNSDPPGVVQLRASGRFQVKQWTIEDVFREDISEANPEAYVIVSGDNCEALDAILPELRDRNHASQASLLVLYPSSCPEVATRALALGASDVAADDASGEELAFRIDHILERKRALDALRRSNEQSYRLAATDHLTGLYNRRYAQAYLGDLIMRAADTNETFALLIVDLDHFKSVNDRFGHAVGDRVLCEVARRLQQNLRACDLVSRHGGEEFLIILPGADDAQATATAERLRNAISSAPMDATDETITASIGVKTTAIPVELASLRMGTFDLVEPPALSRIFEAADAALYRAKQSGRNRIEISAA